MCSNSCNCKKNYLQKTDLKFEIWYGHEHKKEILNAAFFNQRNVRENLLYL